METISVVGLGKLGLPLAAALADRGFQVIGVDINEDVVQSVNDHVPRIFEPGLADLMVKVGNRLVATTDVSKAVRDTDITIILVPTPSRPDGSFTSKYVLGACSDLGQELREKDKYHLVVIASTVMPGECRGAIKEQLESASGKEVGPHIGLCYCPEFVALGNIIEGFQQPDFVLIGAIDDRAAQTLKAVYERFCPNNPPIALTSLVNAELSKIALNCYVTMKITFANQLARLCERIPGAHVDEVTDAIGLDSRIGRKYLTGATAYSGACFPRDVRAMARVAAIVGTRLSLIERVDELNREEVQKLVRVACFHAACFHAAFAREAFSVVGVLGLTFNPDTDVTEESVGLALVSALGKLLGIEAISYDPMAACSHNSAQECVDDADIVAIVVQWPEFKTVKFHEGQHVIDVWRMLNREEVEAQGALYVPIGVGPS